MSEIASKFVILGVQRTGTTWIRTTLNNHPSILALGEVFLYSHGRFPFRRQAGLDVEQSYRKFIETSPQRRLQHRFRRSVVVTEYMNELYAQPDYRAIGFKLMRTHCRQFPTVVQYLLDQRVPAIHVVRNNVLKTLISRETAKQRKLFHASGEVPVKKIRIDADSLLTRLRGIVADNDEWERVFGKSQYLRVSYESFVSDREQQLLRLYDFLSIPPDVSVSSNLVKINPDAIQDVLLNYDEVSQTLAGTPFEACLTQ